MSVSVSVHISDALAKKLEKISRAVAEPAEHLITRAIHDYVRDYADAEIARERFADDDDEIISSAELRKRLARREA